MVFSAAGVQLDAPRNIGGRSRHLDQVGMEQTADHSIRKRPRLSLDWPGPAHKGKPAMPDWSARVHPRPAERHLGTALRAQPHYSAAEPDRLHRLFQHQQLELAVGGPAGKKTLRVTPMMPASRNARASLKARERAIGSASGGFPSPALGIGRA